MSNRIVESQAKSQQEKRRESRYIGYAFWCTFALIVLAVGVYFGPQTIAYWELRSVVSPRSSDIPPRGWSSVPRPLTDTTVSPAEGTVLSYYGYKFEVPWPDRDKERNEGRWVEVTFKSGQTIRFTNPAFFQDNPISGHFVDSYYFKEAFGPGIRESKYEQFKAVISTVPSQWSPLLSHREFARVRILLEIKGLWFEHNAAVPDIFSFETKSYRGFEFSGLSHDWQDVDLNLFDPTDHSFHVSILGYAGSGVRLTQSEINRIIQSFGPAASE